MNACVQRAIAGALAEHGLVLRGSFRPSTHEGARGPSGDPARGGLLVGHAGASHWPHFSAWRARKSDSPLQPLDTWSREVLDSVAGRFGAAAAYPSDTPFLPFQQWAMRAEGLRPSPLGILMHPRYGLWHAYRGALLFDVEVTAEAPRAAAHLCNACAEKPCLQACPVGAYGVSGYAYGDCVSHVRSAPGKPCRHHGCFSRNACPAGAEFRYPAEVQAFHMRAFAEPERNESR